ncbi:MAG TPA: VOC family protein [Trebonia sp.]|nr:VOC family protein [Trebonia sp.]
MRVRGISWVGVKTSSYPQMREFFVTRAGLAVDFERPDFAVLRFPNGDKLEIFGPEAAEPPEQFARNQVEASLLVDDFDEAVEELRAAGIELVGECGDGGEGYRWQHFRAPDGKVFELVADPAHP